MGIQVVLPWILCFFAASISSAGGVGGGSLFLPILNLVAGLELKTAANFSAFMVTGGSLSSVVFNLWQPNSGAGSSIDYDIALLSQPCLLLGVSVGVFFNIMFPEWMITVLFDVLLAYSTFKTCRAGVMYWKVESDEACEKRRMEEGLLGEEEGEIAAGAGIPWGKMLVLVLVWMSFFGLHLLVGDKDGKGFIHIKPCGVGYWLVTSFQIPLAFGFTAFVLHQRQELQQRNPHEHTQHNVCKTRIEAFPKIIFPVASLLSGTLGGLFGIGGGLLINPVLLQIGVPPLITAATTCFMVLFSSSMSSAQYLILGMNGVRQALGYAILCFVASIVGLAIIQKIVVRSGRASVIVFTVSIVMALSTVSITCFGAMDVWRQYRSGENMSFKLPC